MRLYKKTILEKVNKYKTYEKFQDNEPELLLWIVFKNKLFLIEDLKRDYSKNNTKFYDFVFKNIKNFKNETIFKMLLIFNMTNIDDEKNEDIKMDLKQSYMLCKNEIRRRKIKDIL